ncbi:uncharacterized protein [Macrobrachium rosenbergii]|uniref:uncharacterized protein n=1 Tax=Macrobrachium rosenbergii TaxID=79674 RepID=UPI0034D634CA
MNSPIKISTAIFVLWISTRASSRPQDEGDVSMPEKDGLSSPLVHVHHESQYSSMTRDALRWIWIDETSLELTWSSKFSLSLNDAVKGYGLSLTHPQHFEPFSTTTIYSSNNLQHQFGGLKSNVTYGGKLEALVGPHYWPYNLLNFTFSSAVLVPGVGLGQRGAAERPTSNTADLGKVAVGVTLRWSHSPFTTGALTSSEWDAGGGRPEGLKPDGYLLQIWDHKHLMLKLTTSVSGKHDGCIANVGGLSLDTAYKATLQGLHADGRVGTALSFSLDAGAFYVAGGGMTTDGVSECYSGLQVKCPTSDRCVSPYWICDGAPDCPNGEDEIGCDKSPCDGFRCWDNVCIPSAWRCDGHRDCKDGDDEYSCSGCNEGEIACSTVGFCFYPNATCDGIPDCPDGWDESLAVCGGKECSPGELPCWDNDHCVEHSRLCDGTPDCPTSEDEDRSFCIAFKSMQETTTLAVDLQASLCDQKPYMKETNCSLDDYQCESGECIPKMYFCNGHSDCQTGDDEEPNACSFYNKIPPGMGQLPQNITDSGGSKIKDCGENMVECPSGKCVLKNKKCSLAELCNDSLNKDECEHGTSLNLSNDIEDNITESSAEDEEYMKQNISDKPNNLTNEVKVLGNMTNFSNVEHNLTSPPVLKDLDLGSLEEDTQTHYQTPSQEVVHTQETISSSDIDFNFKVIVEDSSESSEGENLDTGFKENNKSSADSIELSNWIRDDQNLSTNSSDSQELFAEEIVPNATLKISISDSDIFANFNASLEENEIDERVKNATKILKLDSDEERDDTDLHLETLYDSMKDSDGSDEDLERDNLEDNEPVGQIKANSSDEDSIISIPHSEINMTTILPLNATLDSDLIIQDDSESQTAGSQFTDIDTTTLAFATEEMTSLYTTDSNLLLNSFTSDKKDEDMLQKATETVNDNIHPSPGPTNRDTTISSHLLKTELDHSEHTAASQDEAQYQSTTELAIMDLEDSTTNADVTIPVSTEPDNWKDMAAGQKNLTILIAVHSVGNESKIPQYIIHGLDGSTYEYEVVGVNEDDSFNRTETNNEGNNRQMVHEYSGGIHELSYLHDKISSGTKLTCEIPLLILVIFGVIQNI